jgi:protein-disulfide isomerase-like protein with CxxC motif
MGNWPATGLEGLAAGREGGTFLDQVKFYFDPACPWCYQTSRWARRVEELGEIELDWGIFSLEVINLPAGKDVRDLEPRSGPALRTAIAIRESQGSKAIGPFYAALGKRIWEQPPPPDDMVAAVRESLQAAGLRPTLADSALADPSTWDAVLAEHRALVEKNHGFGVPTLVLDGGAGPEIFGPVISTLPNDEDAVALWRHTSWLVRYGNFAELKRTRLGRPDLATIRWRSEQQKQSPAGAPPR